MTRTGVIQSQDTRVNQIHTLVLYEHVKRQKKKKKVQYEIGTPISRSVL